MKVTGWLGAMVLLAACGNGRQPGSKNLSINEIMASNAQSCTDDTGASPDWIELYNAGTEALNLEGYVLADDTDLITDDQRLGSAVTVPPGGVRVLWADGRPELGPLHLGFKLSALTEKLLLYGPDNALLDRYDWKMAVSDEAFARFPDGTGPFVRCKAPTCNLKNLEACEVP